MGGFNRLGRATHGVAGAQPLGKDELELGVDLDGSLQLLTQRVRRLRRFHHRRYRRQQIQNEELGI